MSYLSRQTLGEISSYELPNQNDFVQTLILSYRNMDSADSYSVGNVDFSRQDLLT